MLKHILWRQKVFYSGTTRHMDMTIVSFRESMKLNIILLYIS